MKIKHSLDNVGIFPQMYTGLWMCIVDAVEDHLGIVQNLLWDVCGRQKKVGKKESSGWFGEEQVWETRGKRGKKPTIN